MGALTTQRGELEQTCFFAADNVQGDSWAGCHLPQPKVQINGTGCARAPAKRGRGTGWAGRGGGGRKRRVYLRSWGPPTRPLWWWTRRGSRGPPAQHDRRMRSVARGALCPLRGSLGHTRRDKRAGRDTRQGSEHGKAVHETLCQLRTELCSSPEDSCKLFSTFVLLNAAQIRHRRRGKRQKLPQRTPRADLAFLTCRITTKEGPISWTTALMALIRTSGAGELGHAESPCRAQIVVTNTKLFVTNLLELDWM
jgi:hypothetical protein